MRLPTDRPRSPAPLPAEIDDLFATARADAAAGCWSDVRDLLASRDAEREERPELTLMLAEAEMRLGNPRSARTLVARALPTLARAEDADALRRATNLLGAACFALGEIDAAETAFGHALELSYAAGDLLQAARVMNNLGAIANVRGQHERARIFYGLALPVYGRLEHTMGLAETHHNVAITCRDLGQHAEAEHHERRALALAADLRDARLEQMARVGLAELSLRRGNARGADSDATRAAVACASAPDPTGEADALRLVGEARAAAGDRHEALDVLERAVALARSHGCSLIEEEALRARSAIYEDLGLDAFARRDAEEAARLRARRGV